MTLLEAARQALPGLEWELVGKIVQCEFGQHGIGIAPTYKGKWIPYMRADGPTFDTPAKAAAWLRERVIASRDEHNAALCDPPHLGTSAADWAGMWDVARQRADAAEAEVKRLTALVAERCRHD